MADVGGKAVFFFRFFLGSFLVGLLYCHQEASNPYAGISHRVSRPLYAPSLPHHSTPLLTWPPPSQLMECATGGPTSLGKRANEKNTGLV